MKFVQTLVLLGCFTAVACAICQPLSETISFDYRGVTSVNGYLLDTLQCVKDTQIDFNFPQAAQGSINITTNPGATGYKDLMLNNDSLTLQFLNRDGLNQSYKLTRVTLSNPTAGARIRVAGHPYESTSSFTELSLTYQNDLIGQSVGISIYLVSYLVGISDGDQTKITIRNSYQLPTDFVGFIKNLVASTSTSTSIQKLGALSFLNQLDFGVFYTQQNDAADGCKVNYLLSRFVYQMPNDFNFDTITLSPYTTSTTSKLATTGNMLCWGSNTNLGTFQTHMRDNFALWAGWWSVLIFWIAILVGDATTLNCFDRKFENNKWTCWSMYSLFYLAHEDFFSRMSRNVPLYISFCWQGCVCAILYSKLYAQFPDPTTIIWFGVIAWACSFPLQFIYGIFTSRMYRATLDKYNQRKSIKKLFDKESNEAHIFEDRIDECESTIYGSYYWMYVFSFACFVTFQVLSVNLLQQIPREQYDTMNKYWVGATLVAWGLDVFVIDPLLTLLFGNFRFYRFRPYFYDYAIGDTFKEIES